MISNQFIFFNLIYFSKLKIHLELEKFTILVFTDLKLLSLKIEVCKAERHKCNLYNNTTYET